MPKHSAIGSPKPLHNGRDTNIGINRAPSPTWIKNWRDKIEVGSLLTRLQNFAKDDPDNPLHARMTRTQATVALSLLRKVLPDMQALEISGNSEKPLVVQVMRFSDGLVIEADHNPVGSPPQIGDGIVEKSEDGLESRTNPSPDVDSISKSGDENELPPSIESNPRLIEDEPKRKRTSPRRTSRPQ